MSNSSYSDYLKNLKIVSSDKIIDELNIIGKGYLFSSQLFFFVFISLNLVKDISEKNLRKLSPKKIIFVVIIHAFIRHIMLETHVLV